MSPQKGKVRGRQKVRAQGKMLSSSALDSVPQKCRSLLLSLHLRAFDPHDKRIEQSGCEVAGEVSWAHVDRHGNAMPCNAKSSFLWGNHSCASGSVLKLDKFWMHSGCMARINDAYRLAVWCGSGFWGAFSRFAIGLVS